VNRRAISRLDPGSSSYFTPVRALKLSSAARIGRVIEAAFITVNVPGRFSAFVA
jgi:hypothetical protein